MRTLTIGLMVVWMGMMAMTTKAGEVENLGIPVRTAGLRTWIVGPDAEGKNTQIYASFNQDGAPLFLLQINPATGEVNQYVSPTGPGAWALTPAPDGVLYLGTYDGGLVLRFDPKQPEKGIEVVGRPSETETYIWQYTVGKDGKLYGCTYGNAKLVSVDPRTGELADLGRMDPTEQYSRTVATGAEGWIYTGIGSSRGSIVGYNPQTGEHQMATPEEHVIGGWGRVWNGADGNAYGQLGDRWYRLIGGRAEEIEKQATVDPAPQQLADGRIVTKVTNDGTYTLLDPQTEQAEARQFEYEGAGSRLFVVAEGPDERIYGGSILPLRMFRYDPATGELVNQGNPTGLSDGEIYSFAHDGQRLFLAAYPGSYLSIYDPAKPWDFGTRRENNPYGFGRLGDGHLRPRAMIYGSDGRVYIGSLPAYGELGGALGVFDPGENRLVENYRHLIPDQAIVALVEEPQSGWIFGGSTVTGGGGAHVTENDAHLFAWDPVKKEKVVDLVPIPGRGAVLSLAEAGGKVFAVLSGSTLVVYDVKAGKVVHQADLGVPGGALEVSLVSWEDGKLYGLTRECIYSIDPETYRVEVVADPEEPITCGMAVTDDGIYYGSLVHLMRYRW